MKLTLSALIAALCWSIRLASASKAQVWVYEPAWKNEEQLRRPAHQLEASEARMILAQRAGVEDFHDADVYEEFAINAINVLGTRRQLFSQAKQPKSAFILATGVQDPEAFMPSMSAFEHFYIWTSPSEASTTNLFRDLIQQSESTASSGQTHDLDQTILFDAEGAERERWYTTANQTQLSQTLSSFNWNEYSLTIIFPDGESSESSTEWGTYKLPYMGSQLRKRAAQKEAPLEEDIGQPSTATTTFASSSNKTSHQLKGVFPTCFPSLSTCQSLTQNCTSHGSCQLKYTDPTADDKSPYRSCYTCSCSPTVRKNSDGGVKTTYWGGPACQKKDVSVQFWLISLFVVGLVGLVSFAVGSVWEMGDEKLPSVIGAGVSGVGARSH